MQTLPPLPMLGKSPAFQGNTAAFTREQILVSGLYFLDSKVLPTDPPKYLVASIEQVFDELSY